MAKVILVNNRIITKTFNGNPSLTVVIKYATTIGNKDLDKHYETFINEILKHHVTLKMRWV